MWIKVKRICGLTNLYAGHAWLEAWSDDPSDFYTHSDNRITNGVRLNYGLLPANIALLILGRGRYKVSLPTMNFFPKFGEDKYTEDPYSVLFEVTLPFQQFCEQLIKSGYDTSIDYDLQKNNCVDAVIFALKIAGVKFDFDVDKSHCQCKHLICCCWGPTNLMTSSEFIRHLKRMNNRTLHPERVRQSVSNRHFLQNTVISPISQASLVCDANQCVSSQSSFAITPILETPFSVFSNHTEREMADLEKVDATEMNSENGVLLDSILPPNYYEAMLQAAKLGFLYSFLASIPIEVFSDYFKESGFTTEKTFYANQVIRALTILAISAYLGLLDTKTVCLILGSPLASFGLKKYFSIPDTIAQTLPMGAVVTTEILMDMASTPKLLMTVLTAAASGWAGAQTFRTGYELTRHSIFFVKKQISKLYVSDDISSGLLVKR